MRVIAPLAMRCKHERYRWFAGVALVLLIGFSEAFGSVHHRPRFAFSDHYDGKHFHNRGQVDGAESSGAIHVMWELYRKQAKWPTHLAASSLHPGNADTEGVRATYVGHATVLLRINGVNILTDPVFSGRIGINHVFGFDRAYDPGIRIEDLPHIDVVLISHNHYDHLDLPSLKAIARRQGDRQPLILTGLGNKTLLERSGLRNVQEMDWDQSMSFQSLHIYFLESIHNSRRGLFDGDKTLWGSFLIDAPAGRVYFAGDTAYGAHFGKVYKRFGSIQLALLPIGAYEPEWFMTRVHMTPAQAVRAHLDLHSEKSMAIHFDTFNLAEERFGEAGASLSNALTARSLDPGVFVLLPPGVSTVAADASARPER